MIKLIVSDIDGTLLEDGGNQINPELFDVILQLKNKGIHFAAASGRQCNSIKNAFLPIKDQIFHISDNGARIGCHDRALFLHTIEPHLVTEVIKDIKAAGLDIMLSGKEVVYLDKSNEKLIKWMRDGYKYNLEIVDDLSKVRDEWIKVTAYKEKGVEAVTKDIQAKYNEVLKVAVAGEMWLDMMAPGINKGGAVKLLQESLDIKKEETMVFGDQLNDIEMMQQAYYSFAVGNARAEIKNVARFQTDTCNRDGVLKILKTLL